MMLGARTMPSPPPSSHKRLPGRRVLLQLSYWLAALLFVVRFTVAHTHGGTAREGGFAHAGSKPNLVFILADDLGWGNIGFHNGVTHSPHIDALFTLGLKLNHT